MTQLQRLFPTMLIPSHALNVACECSMRDPSHAVRIARRVLSNPGTDERTAVAAMSLIRVIGPVTTGEW